MLYLFVMEYEILLIMEYDFRFIEFLIKGIYSSRMIYNHGDFSNNEVVFNNLFQD